MNIEDMIMNGASDSEIEAMIAAVKAAKAKQEEEKKAQAQAKKEIEKKEQLKREARAYVINAMIAYAEVFDLLEEGEVLDEQMITKIENLVIEYEKMIPVYVTLARAAANADSIPYEDFTIEDIEKFFK